jgi:hypothetical protein
LHQQCAVVASRRGRRRYISTKLNLKMTTSNHSAGCGSKLCPSPPHSSFGFAPMRRVRAVSDLYCVRDGPLGWAREKPGRGRLSRPASLACHIFNAARPNVSGRRRSRWTDRDATGGEASGKQSSVLAAPTEEGAPARAVGVVPLECVKSFAVARAKANVNPPASVPQIAGTDT